MDTETALLAGLIAFVAAVCQAVTGFAFALIFAPLFALAWEPKPAVAVAVVLSVVVNTLVLLQVRGHVTTRRLPGLYAGYLAGVGPGLLFLRVVSGEVLQITLGVVVLLATVVLYTRTTTEEGPDTLVAWSPERRAVRLRLRRALAGRRSCYTCWAASRTCTAFAPRSRRTSCRSA